MRRRPPGEPDPYVPAKLALLFLGAGFFVAGVITGLDWPVLVAIVILAAGMAVRFLPSRRGE